MDVTSLTAVFKSNGSGIKSKAPASILEKSNMSFIILKRSDAELLITSKKSFCRSVVTVLASNSAIPKIPFIGVRIS